MGYWWKGGCRKVGIEWTGVVVTHDYLPFFREEQRME